MQHALPSVVDMWNNCCNPDLWSVMCLSSAVLDGLSLWWCWLPLSLYPQETLMCNFGKKQSLCVNTLPAIPPEWDPGPPLDWDCAPQYQLWFWCLTSKEVGDFAFSGACVISAYAAQPSHRDPVQSWSWLYQLSSRITSEGHLLYLQLHVEQSTCSSPAERISEDFSAQMRWDWSAGSATFWDNGGISAWSWSLTSLISRTGEAVTEQSFQICLTKRDLSTKYHQWHFEYHLCLQLWIAHSESASSKPEEVQRYKINHQLHYLL